MATPSLTASGENLTFYEEQRFRQQQKWLWCLLLSIDAITVGFFLHSVSFSNVLNPSDRGQLTTNLILLGACVLAVFLIIGLTWLISLIKLVTAVTQDGLFVQFFPLRRKAIDLTQLQHCEPCTYNPLFDYGGWGIRKTLKGNAYSISGNRGVQLEFAAGKPLLIGSQRPEELAQAIAAYRRNA